MSLLVPNVGEVKMLEKALNKVAADDVKIHLYSSDTTPGEDDTVASYTLITDPVAITLTGASWTIATLTGTTTAEYAQQTFTFAGAATVYGYAVTDNGETNLLWAERFTDGPYTIPSGGGSIKITPKIALE